MAPTPHTCATTLSSFNTHVDDPERQAELSHTYIPQEFTEGLDSIARGRSNGGVEAGDTLDGEMNKVSEEKPVGQDPFMVVFEPGDPENPKNWGRTRRWILSLAVSLLELNSPFASSAPSGIMKPVIEHFKLSEEVAILTVSLFVAGYCFGPLLWGPLSEQYGRKPIFVISFVGYTAFQIGDALAPNVASLLVFRFLSGAFGACPLTNSGAFMGDIWDAKTRGTALALFCIAPFAGPALAPAVGGYIAVSGASWRWLYWACACFAGLCLFFTVFFLPETYEPVILAHKAERKRRETGDKRYFAEIERREMAWTRRAGDVVTKSVVVLVSEPMLIAITVYMAFVYGCIYMLYEAYPIVFELGHNMNAGLAGLMFVPVLVGAIASVAIYLAYFEPIYTRKLAELAPRPVPPEERLRVAVWIGPMFVIGFFWFGWTSYPSISFWAPMMSGFFIGASVVLVFLSLVNYIVDAYLTVSASALAANTVVRSLAGASFPLFATQMFNKLDPRWASTLVGFIALLLAPIPLVLIRYGPYLRRKSKYAPS